MSDRVPTITIKTANGPVDINLTDYDSSIHEVYQAPVQSALVSQPVVVEPQITTVKKEATPVLTYTVGKNGKRGGASKFVVLDSEGNHVGAEEYSTEDEANAAIQLLIAG